ncbi:MAG: DUF5060 domain-containing protein, partial [Planctomycetota bacterium]
MILLLSYGLGIGILGADDVTGTQWEMSEIEFNLESPVAQPFQVELQATFELDEKDSMTVPGFFNGDQQFLVRFTPPKPGAWSYKIESSHDPLNGRTGKLIVETAPTGTTGAVEVEPKTKRRFQFQNGDDYFPIAFESDWLFALDAENRDGIPKTEKFVDYLADNGFNQLVMNVFAYDVNWPKDKSLDSQFEYGSPDVFPFGGDNENPDHSTLNIEYFKRFDRVVEYLNQKDVIAHLMIYVWNKNVNWPESNSKQDDLYFDYVVKRYQAYPNLIWDISKEATGYGHNDVHYITDRIERLRRLDGHKRLVTVHDYGYCR